MVKGYERWLKIVIAPELNNPDVRKNLELKLLFFTGARYVATSIMSIATLLPATHMSAAWQGTGQGWPQNPMKRPAQWHAQNVVLKTNPVKSE